MASYNSPTEDITSFNTLLFNQPEVILSQAEADLLYLSKVSTTISTAGSTTFSNAVSVGGNFTTSAIKSGTIAGANVLYDNLTTGTLAIGSATATNSVSGATTFSQNATFSGAVGVGGALNLNAVAVSVSAPNATTLSLFSGYNTNASIFPTFDNGTITVGNGIFPAGALNLCNTVRLRSRINLQKKQIISATTTIPSFNVSSVAETIQITATGNITITLPLCQYSDFEDGLIFRFVKTASITNSITIQANTTNSNNFVQLKGTITSATSQVLLVNAETSTSLVVLFNSPNFIWTEI